ncbi:lipopolysaccharide export system permease protein [Fluviicoccus keumensis]|uniref:Lipopolysaccharide export system permease protein LptF n=1 Tax=Fluviicoccus keumensis TaxID=1435465 RepID=A0A4Q7ZAI0_9GAMM|nr:LPS export ABC transporter permease LptF [Fluviicoccus keumensis]RZU47602.1 lipopolysaccharide export system permease protein [Fluviicoccus keumensis]
MIIRRYLAGQLLVSALAVTSLLTFILMGGRVIKYFGMAAQGKLDVELLSAVLLYRLPGFLELIIPLGLFIAVLLVFGRLYVDNEMAILASSGISRWQLAGHLLPAVVLVTALVSIFSLYFSPRGNLASESLFAAQAKRNTFDLIRPGQFQRVGERILFAREITPDKTRLLQVMMFEERPGAQRSRVMVMAESARRYHDESTGLSYIELEHGDRYELSADSPRYSRLRFAVYRMRVADPADVGEITRARTLSSREVFDHRAEDKLIMGEWLWRVSMPLIVPIAALLALPLSRVSPRQGRFLKLFPAILLYISYVVLIAAARNAIEKGKLGSAGIWGIHLGFFLLGLLMLGWEDIQLWLRRRRLADDGGAA